MTTMIAEIYEALKEAGASDEKSKAAAMAVAEAKCFDKVDADLGIVRSDLTIVKADVGGIKIELAVVKAELAMVKWIVSGVDFGVVLLVLRSFWPS
jgi:hypothetical protein